VEGKKMDGYSPKRHDIAQLKFLCKNLHDESMVLLGDSHHGWVNDPTSAIHLQLNDLIEHIAAFVTNYRIKNPDDDNLAEQVDSYLDDTFMLFGNYGVTTQDLQRWQNSSERLFRMISEECAGGCLQPSHSLL